MAYVTNLDPIHTPTTGADIPAVWGQAVNENFRTLLADQVLPNSGRTARLDNTASAIPGTPVAPTGPASITGSPSIFDTVIQEYSDGIVVSVFDGTFWSNTRSAPAQGAAKWA